VDERGSADRAAFRAARGYPAVAMATRTIVTSQPDVACDVCDRRLLRGEQHDTFLAAGRRRTVCELCAPRAVHEGWQRETERQSVSLPSLRPRRGRSFFERLRQVGRPLVVEAAEGVPYAVAPQAGGATDRTDTPEPFDFLDARAPVAAPGTQPLPAADGVPDEAAAGPGVGAVGMPAPVGQESVSGLERALEVFNASEYPRRIAGVARSLGTPEVSVRSAEHARSVIVIVVAWELSWYRYTVDLDEPEAGARLLEQGTELAELARDDRLVNAVAEESGALRASGF
jgi:hypothetical protein